MATACDDRLDSRLARRARAGWSDLAIRNLFIIPTILFLIIFNIFPLIYSLGYSFTDIARLATRRRTSSACRTTATCWPTRTSGQLHHHREVRDRLGRRADDRRLRPGAAAQPQRSRSRGCVTTLLLLPMMMSPAVVGLFWQLLYGPSWGSSTTLLGLGDFAWLSDPDVALYAVAITDIWMWSPFVMLLSLAGLSAVPKHLYEAAAIDRAGALVHLHAASRCRWWRRCC